MSKAKVLFLDIETSPIVAHVWGLWDQNIALNQIHTDWYVLSWAAKWRGKEKILYEDLRRRKDGNDKYILSKMWDLLDKADIIVTQNGKSFDQKKLNARFIYHGFKPPSPYKHIDTLRIARRHFAFTSNKLENLAEVLGVRHKKLVDRKFQGFNLWKECLSGNNKAWKEMERYNKRDVLVLESVYNRLIPWDSSVNFSLYRDDSVNECSCGSIQLHRRGYYYTSLGKYQKYRCNECGAETYSGKNLLPKGRAHKGVKR